MKKISLLIMALAVTFVLQAQWADDPINNNHIANCSSDAGEIYLSTDGETGDTYVQWTSSGGNGYGPALQRLTFDGTPQWGDNGIRISGHNFYSYSEGIAMTTTADHAVVSCFATANDQSVAVKINSDGTYAWGEQGVTLFDGNGFSRVELVAGNNGGVWALGYDYQRLYLQYVNADGTLNPSITVDGGNYNVRYGKLTLGAENSVFLTYEQVSSGMGLYAAKEIYVIGYATDGSRISPAVQLMSTQTFQVTYLHYAIPDGLGGGYAYIWHPGIGNAFNTYVFHYDANGASTIADQNGTPVHSTDPANYYLDAYGTVDPVSHDLIIGYEQTDAYSQSQSRIYVNRITSTGQTVWGDGILVADNNGSVYSNVKVDAFEDGSGFVLIYTKSGQNNSYNSTVEAVGMNMQGDTLWTKTISSSEYGRTMCRNTTGYNRGQDVVAWVNSSTGDLYGQNIRPDGTLGPEIDPDPDPDPDPETGLADRTKDVIINVLCVFDMKGQLIKKSDLNDLTPGIYILQGLTEDGRLVNRKVLINWK